MSLWAAIGSITNVWWCLAFCDAEMHLVYRPMEMNKRRCYSMPPRRTCGSCGLAVAFTRHVWPITLWLRNPLWAHSSAAISGSYRLNKGLGGGRMSSRPGRSCHHRSCRSWCWRWNRIWLSHSLGVSQSNAFEATLWVRHLRLCPLGGDGTLCPLGGLRNPLWAPHSWRLVDFGMPILALRLLPRFHLLSAWTHLRGGV